MNTQLHPDLSKVLANLYLLQIKTQNFHWNVEGPLFYSLHKLFEEHYNFLFTSVDEVAERIRAMGCKAPGSYAEFSKMAIIKEAPEAKINAGQMIESLTQDHEAMSKLLGEVHAKAAEAEDTPTAVILEDLMQFHSKAAWMIRAHRS